MADKKDNTPKDTGSKPVLTTSSSLDKPLLDEKPLEEVADTSSSLDKPLLDEKPLEEVADIDTSHLTLDDNTAQAGGSLEKEREESAASIKTSHLSLKDEGKTPASNKPENNAEQTQPPVNEQETTDQSFSETKPEPDDGSLIINNPYVKKESSESTAEKPDSSSEIAPKDEQVMLTSGVSDAEFEKEAHSEEAKNTTDEIISENDFNPEETGAIKQLLDTVKKPENIVRDAWSNSSARRYLIDNVDSYRQKDEDQNMEEVIEKIYGDASEDKFSPGKFLKENILFSFLVSIFLFLVGWKAAGIFFPDVMPAINDQIIESVQKQTSNKTKTAEKSKPVVTNTANKEKIDSTLAHCLVKPAARKQFAAAFNKVGYEYSNQSLTIAYEETRDSIKVWESLDMDFYIKDTVLRFGELAGLALPYIENAREEVSDYSRSLIRISEEANELESRIRKIKTSKGNQSTNTINERLLLRNKLNKLNSRLAEEPDQERFIKILAKLGLIEQILLGHEEPFRVVPDQITEKDPDWLIATADTAASEIVAPINEYVLPPIQLQTEKLKESSPKLAAYHLSELEIALDNLLNLSSLIVFLPENKLVPFELETSGLNRRLNKLMKMKLPAWINTNQCLTTMRSASLATP
jgi:uncharacterized protein YdcH (DUF465 family)